MLTLLAVTLLAAAPPAAPDADGFLTHGLRSEYQPGVNPVRVLLPAAPRDGETFPVVYVLPVEARDGRRYGDGLAEVRRLGLPEKYRAIFVGPSFDSLPWYADHPTDPLVRQESHLLRAVLPMVEEAYPARRDAAGRLLLGFSKSGWGAFSLLLRHPDVFGGAAAWDTPFMMDRPGPYGSGPVFGDARNFEGYRLTSLLKERGNALGGSPRLIHLGRGNFHEEHDAFERLLVERNVPHRYVVGPPREHRWDSGWVAEAVGALLVPSP